MIIETLEHLEKFGIYKITNIKNGKFYIGSTTRSFKDRFNDHARDLKNNKHKNYYLQSAYNKYGDSSFKFEILEVLENNTLVLEKEQYYITTLCISKKISYNINLEASGGNQFSSEIYKKRAQSFKKTNSIALEYAKKIKENEFLIEDVPDKYKKRTLWFLSPRDSSKNRTKKNGYTFDHLKVPKTITEEFKRARKISQIKNRESKTPYIAVYDTFGNYINTFRSATDIEEFSIKNPTYFPILSKNLNSKNKSWILKKANIINNCNSISKHYKGLQFKFVDSDKEIVFLKITDLNSKINLNVKQRRENNIIDRYSRLLEQSNMKNSLNSVDAPEQSNTEPSINLND